MRKSHIINLLVAIYFIIIILLMTRNVLPIFGSIIYGDGPYFYNIESSWVEIASTFSPNYLGEDQSNILFAYVPRVIIIFILKSLRLSDNLISYLMIFGLLTLAGLIYHSICYKISRNIYLGLIAGTFVILNNLTFEYIIFGGGFYYFSGLISLGILLYVMWLTYQKKELSMRYSYILILNSILLIHPFYFIITVLQLLIFFLMLIIQSKSYKKNSNAIIVLIGIFAINAYWLIPFIFGSLNRPPEITYDINLENVFNGFLNVSSYVSAVNFFHYPGFISKNFHQTFGNYVFYIGILILLSISISKLRISKNKDFLTFILFSYILFFNLSLGPKSMIFGDSWLYLWKNVEFFKFFRTFSRFLIIIIPLYMIYFSIINLEWKNRFKNVFFVIIIISILSLNYSAFSGDLKGNILATNVPIEYLNMNKYLERDKSINNIISYPIASYESYTWGINNNPKIIQQSYYLKDYLFIKPIIYERTALSLAIKNKIFYNAFEFNTTYLEDSFDKMNIGYVLVQKNSINIFTLKIADFQKYENYFNSNPKYKMLTNNTHFNLYKYNKQTFILYSNESDLIFERINPTKYRIFLKNINESKNITFLQKFNKNWKLYPKKLKDRDELDYLLLKPVLEANHSKVLDYANGWTIDPIYIKENYPGSYYLNPNGSIDLELTLYFISQSYFYLGLIISGMTLIICIIYLLLSEK